MLSGRESSSAFRAERCGSHFTSGQGLDAALPTVSIFLISDPGGCFVSREMREWAGIRGIGLLTAPGEFHGLTADLENLIRVIKHLARQLADDHPDLTLASCVSLALFFTQQWFQD